MKHKDSNIYCAIIVIVISIDYSSPVHSQVIGNSCSNILLYITSVNLLVSTLLHPHDILNILQYLVNTRHIMYIEMGL